MSHGDATGDRAYFFFVCDSWTGTPFNKEPEKCAELAWRHVSDLPEGTLPHVRHALGALLNSDVRYGESGYSPTEFSIT